MRRTSLLLALVLLAMPLAAQDVPTPDPTATGGGMYSVIVDGDTVSQHTTERIAAARAFQELARCVWTCTVTYRRDYEVRMGVRWLTLEEAPAPEPEPDPEPEPTDPGDLIFRSTWSTATGNSEPAIKDGGAWGEHFWCGGNLYEVLSVVEGAPLGWTRTPNVFATQMRGGSGEMCGAVQRSNAVPASTTHWGRLYFRNDDDEWAGAQHNFSYNFVGSIQLVYHNLRGSSQGVRHNVYLGSAYPYTSWHAQHPGSLQDWIYLENETWYRYEWMVEYVTPTEIRFWPRIYNMAGELLLDSDDYYQLDHPNSGPHNLTSWYAAGNTFTKDPELMRHIGIGNEGRPGPNTGKHWYTADFAISTEGWIGDR